MFWIILIVFIGILSFMDLEVIGEFHKNKIKLEIVIFRYIGLKINMGKEYKKLKRKNKQKGARLEIKTIIKIITHMIMPIKGFLKKSDMSLNLYANFGFATPDKTALSYGLFYALTSNLYSISKNYFKSYEQKVNFVPDFKSEKLDYKIKIYLHTRLIYLIILGKNILINILKNKLKLQSGRVFNT